MQQLRVIVVGLLGAAAFAGFASSASASTVTFSPGGPITATANQTLTFDPGGIFTPCDLTFVFRLTTTRISGATLPIGPVQIGSVTGSVGPCSGTVAFLGQPWPLFATVSGPSSSTVTSLTIGGWQSTWGMPAALCLYTGGLSGTLNTAGTRLSVPAQSIGPPVGPWCPNPGVIVGTLAVSPALSVLLRP